MSCLFWKDRVRNVPQSYIYLRAAVQVCREKWKKCERCRHAAARETGGLAGQ